MANRAIRRTEKLFEIPNAGIYRRESGDLYFKLTDKSHMKIVVGNDAHGWTGEGLAERLNPEEKVERIF